MVTGREAQVASVQAPQVDGNACSRCKLPSNQSNRAGAAVSLQSGRASPHGNVQLLHDMQRLACDALFGIENTCRGVGLLQDQVVLRLLVTGCNGNVQTEELP